MDWYIEGIIKIVSNVIIEISLYNFIYVIRVYIIKLFWMKII